MCCPARASCRRSSGSAASRCAGRSRRCVTRGLSSPARASAGSSPRCPCSSDSSRLDTIEAQLEERGVHPQRQILEFAFVAAPAHVRAALGCEQVLRVKRLNLADGAPFAVVTVWCPAELGEHLSRRDVERKPFYELLGVELRGATQTIGAAAPSDGDAALLQVPGGQPGAAVRARHHHCGRRPDPAERAHLPGAPHRVRGRPAPGRTDASCRAGCRLVE